MRLLAAMLTMTCAWLMAFVPLAIAAALSIGLYRALVTMSCGG